MRRHDGLLGRIGNLNGGLDVAFLPLGYLDLGPRHGVKYASSRLLRHFLYQHLVGLFHQRLIPPVGPNCRYLGLTCLGDLGVLLIVPLRTRGRHALGGSRRSAASAFG